MTSSTDRPSLPAGWVVVADRQSIVDQIQRPLRPEIQLGGVEIRLDLWRDGPPILVPQEGLSVLVTDRGGLQQTERTATRNQLCQKLGAILDVDPTTDEPPPAGQPWIYSCHRTDENQISAQQQVSEARQMGAIGAKIVMPRASEEYRQIALELPRFDPQFPVVCFCAGLQGTDDRMLALELGQPWGYAKLDQYPEGIAGLPTLDQIYQRLQRH